MRKVYPFSRYILLPFLRFFIRSAVGIENIPTAGPLIVACKHTGPLDGAFIASIVVPHMNDKVRFITNVAPNVWLWREFVAKRWAGSIPFSRKNPSACLTEAMEILQQKKVVGIFPGGLLQTAEEVQRRGKTGVARLALWSRVPVLPVGLHNFKATRRIEIILKHLKNPHNMRITFGKPMTFPEAYDKPITHELLRSVTHQIVDRIETLSSLNS